MVAVNVVYHHLSRCSHRINILQSEIAVQNQGLRLKTWEDLYRRSPTHAELKFWNEVDSVEALGQELRTLLKLQGSENPDKKLVADVTALHNIIRDLMIYVVGSRIERQNAYLRWNTCKELWEEYEDWATWRRRHSMYERRPSYRQNPEYKDDPAADIKEVARLRDVLIKANREFQLMGMDPKSRPEQLQKKQKELMDMIPKLAQAQEQYERIMWEQVEERRSEYITNYTRRKKPFADSAHVALNNQWLSTGKPRRKCGRWVRFVTWLSPLGPPEKKGSTLSLLSRWGWMEQFLPRRVPKPCAYSRAAKKLTRLEGRISMNLDRQRLEDKKLITDMASALMKMLEELLAMKREVERAQGWNQRQQRAEVVRARAEHNMRANEAVRRMQERRARHRQHLMARYGGATTPPSKQCDRDGIDDGSEEDDHEWLAERLLKLTSRLGEMDMVEEEDDDEELTDFEPPPPGEDGDLIVMMHPPTDRPETLPRRTGMQDANNNNCTTAEVCKQNKVNKKKLRKALIKKIKQDEQQQVGQQQETQQSKKNKKNKKYKKNSMDSHSNCDEFKRDDAAYKDHVSNMASKVRFRDSQEKPRYAWTHSMLQNIDEEEEPPEPPEMFACASEDEYRPQLSDEDEGDEDDSNDGQGRVLNVQVVKLPQSSSRKKAKKGNKNKNKTSNAIAMKGAPLTPTQRRAETEFHALLEVQRSQMLQLVDDLAKGQRHPHEHQGGRLTQADRKQLKHQQQELNGAMLQKLLHDQRAQQLQLVDHIVCEEGAFVPLAAAGTSSASSSSSSAAAAAAEEGDWLMEKLESILLDLQLTTGVSIPPLTGSSGAAVAGCGKTQTLSVPPLNCTAVMGGRKVTTV